MGDRPVPCAARGCVGSPSHLSERSLQASECEMTNLATIIDGHPDDAPALVSRGDVTTYAELLPPFGELRGGLTRLGVETGDRVAVASSNNWLFAVSYLAALGTGAVAVPVNPSSPPAELQGQLAAIEAKI